MRIAHVAIWVPNVDEAAAFWANFFEARIGPLYESSRREGFRSRFATLPNGDQIELMSGPWVAVTPDEDRMGWAHVAISLGSEEAVDAAAARFRSAKLLTEEPRRTGDGYYEAVIRTPDGMHIEIVG